MAMPTQSSHMLRSLRIRILLYSPTVTRSCGAFPSAAPLHHHPNPLTAPRLAGQVPLPLSLAFCRLLRGDPLGPDDLPPDGATGGLARSIARLLAAVEAAARAGGPDEPEEERRRRVAAVGARPCTLVHPG